MSRIYDSNISYRNLVSRLLPARLYPVLHNYVIMDVYYKAIPEDGSVSDSIQHFDRHYSSPESVYETCNEPFSISFMTSVPPGGSFALHKIYNRLDMSALPIECISVKLDRSVIDKTLYTHSFTFEQELYRFLAHLNFNVPRIRNLLDLNFFQSTRFLPQYVKMFVCKFSTESISMLGGGLQKKRFFGPDISSNIPVRMLRGKLAECTSVDTLLSLNDDIGAEIATTDTPYVVHYAEKWNALVPLAYNPFENPIIV